VRGQAGDGTARDDGFPSVGTARTSVGAFSLCECEAMRCR